MSFDQRLWADRIKKEKAVRKDEKTKSIVQEVQGDAIFGNKSKYSQQKFESVNPLTGATDEYFKENTAPNQRPPNFMKGNAQEIPDDRISHKVGANMTQQQALQGRCNSLVAKYKQKREKDQNAQVSFDMLLGKGITERDPMSTHSNQMNGMFNAGDSQPDSAPGSRQQQVRVKRQVSTNQMGSKNIIKAMDSERAASANRLGPSQIQRIGGVGTIGSRVAGIPSPAVNNIEFGGANDGQSYLTSAQMYGKTNDQLFGKGASADTKAKYNEQFSVQMEKSRGAKNAVSNDFVLGNNDCAEDKAIANKRQKPPMAPSSARPNLTMDVQAVTDAKELAAFRNRQSNIFSN